MVGKKVKEILFLESDVGVWFCSVALYISTGNILGEIFSVAEMFVNFI